MRGKSIAFMVLILAIATFAVASRSVGAAGTVKVYVWNPDRGDNIYDPLPYPTPTYVEVWIDSPPEWYGTPAGIVAYTVSLRVDPSVVEVLSARKIPDYDFGGWSDGFLGDFLEDNFYYGFDTAFLIGGVDKTTGIITEASEAILGFETLGVGAGGGPHILMEFIIRTKSGVDHTTAYSPIELFDVYYVTVDGFKYPADIVESGHYGTAPVPEFPLGLGLMIAMAPAIPIVYLWRLRKKVIKQ